MSAIFVMLVLKTNIYKSKLIVIQHFASLDIEHSESNTDFTDGLLLALSIMSAIFVMLVLKTNIYKSKLNVIQHFASLDIEHSESNTDFTDGH